LIKGERKKGGGGGESIPSEPHKKRGERPASACDAAATRKEKKGRPLNNREKSHAPSFHPPTGKKEKKRKAPGTYQPFAHRPKGGGRKKEKIRCSVRPRAGGEKIAKPFMVEKKEKEGGKRSSAAKCYASLKEKGKRKKESEGELGIFRVTRERGKGRGVEGGTFLGSFSAGRRKKKRKGWLTTPQAWKKKRRKRS